MPYSLVFIIRRPSDTNYSSRCDITHRNDGETTKRDDTGCDVTFHNAGEFVMLTDYRSRTTNQNEDNKKK